MEGDRNFDSGNMNLRNTLDASDTSDVLDSPDTERTVPPATKTLPGVLHGPVFLRGGKRAIEGHDQVMVVSAGKNASDFDFDTPSFETSDSKIPESGQDGVLGLEEAPGTMPSAQVQVFREKLRSVDEAL